MIEANHLEILEHRLGYVFRDRSRLAEALTHKSFANENPSLTGTHNERLEFLGDAVLDLAVSQYAFDHFPDLPEGELTRIRAEVVSEGSLAAIGRDLALGDSLRLGRGEERSGGRDKNSLLANTLEALLGAIFRDGGFEAACRVALDAMGAPIEQAARRKAGIDYKTRLQEQFQALHGRPPVYHLAGASGPDHERLYQVEVWFDDRVVGRGEGRTKKAAEQAAAREALKGSGS